MAPRSASCCLLHSAALCGRFSLMFAADYDVGRSFLQNGFVVLPNCVSAEDLAAMRHEYERVGPESRAAYEENWAVGKERVDLGKFYSFPMTSPEQPPTFIPLYDAPPLMAMLHRVLGKVPIVGGGGGRLQSEGRSRHRHEARPEGLRGGGGQHGVGALAKQSRVGDGGGLRAHRRADEQEQRR